MSEGKFDELKGRTKEAAGDLSGDRDLEREGKVDRAGGTAKDKLDRFTGKVKEALRRNR